MKNIPSALPSSLVLAAFLGLAGVCSAQPAASNLPANIPSALHADQTRIIADRAILKSDFHALRAAHEQRKTDEASGNKTAAAADDAALADLRAQMKTDWESLKAGHKQLWTDAKPIFDADRSAVDAAVKKLKDDKTANNSKALTADMENVRKAVEQERADKKAVFGPIHGGHHNMNMMHGGMEMHMGMKNDCGGFEGRRPFGFDKDGNHKEMKGDADAGVNMGMPDNP